MPSNYITYDTLTVGLGDDVEPADTVSMTPPPVLATIPRVRGARPNVSKSPSSAGVNEAQLASFQVTTGPTVEIGSPLARKLEQRYARRDTPAVKPTPQPTETPIEPPASWPETPAMRADWTSSLLDWKSEGQPVNKMMLALLVAAVAGLTLLFMEPTQQTVTPPVKEVYNPAPLAAAPPFVPNPPTTTAPVANGSVASGHVAGGSIATNAKSITPIAPHRVASSPSAAYPAMPHKTTATPAHLVASQASSTPTAKLTGAIHSVAPELATIPSQPILK